MGVDGMLSVKCPFLVFVIIQVAVSNQMQQTAATTAGPHQLATPRVGFHH